MKKISIIVPVYNNEIYLNQCLDSIIGQSYSNIEIILVDDGSTDASGKICDQYVAKDNRIFVFHERNNGVSAARNKGINECTGDYVAFVDSDDYVHKDFIKELYDALVSAGADVSVCEVLEFFDGKEFIASEDSYDALQVFSAEEVFENKKNISGLRGIVCNKLIRKNLLNDINFKINIRHEDEFFFTELIDKCSTVVYSKKKYYYYRQRLGSFMSEKLINHLDMFDALYERLVLFEVKYPRLYTDAKVHFCSFCISFYRQSLSHSNMEECRYIKRKIKEMRKKLKFSIREILSYGFKDIIYICMSRFFSLSAIILNFINGEIYE